MPRRRSPVFQPAPWRMPDEAPDPEAALYGQRAEEECFFNIISQARNPDISLEHLLKSTLYLAYPEASEEDVEHSYQRLLKERARQDRVMDREGNPLWITLSLPERADDGKISPSSVLPQGKDKAYRREEELQEKPPKPGFFSRLGTGIAELFRPTKAARPLPDEENGRDGARDAKPGPLGRIIRIALLVLIFSMVYQALLRRGLVSSLF